MRRDLVFSFHDWPVNKKLSTIVLFTSALLIGIMTIAVSVEKYLSYKSKLINSSMVLAEIIGSNATAALVYNDPDTANEILSALKAEKDVLTAALYNSDKKLFSSYKSEHYDSNELQSYLPNKIGSQGVELEAVIISGYFDVYRQIVLKDQPVGYIVLRTNLAQLNSQLEFFLLLISGASFILLTCGMIICSRLNKTITDPVTQLANTMMDVTETQNYSVRVDKKQDDEIGVLITGFNSMLAQIQKRDGELEKYKDHLEELISIRTKELQVANVQLRDEIKERQEVQTKLAHAEKMEAIGTLAGGVAHDLNNILSGIVSYPDLILLDLPRDSKLRVPIEAIRSSGKKAAAIVQDLLSLARRGVKIEQQVDLQMLVLEYLKSPELKELLREHPKVELVFDKQEVSSPLIGSPVHLNKTIMNLVSNGVEAMTEGGILRIAVDKVELDTKPADYKYWKKGLYIRLTVIDTGVGIPQEYVKRIFEPFYSRKIMGKSGTGLGMAVVWGTVEDHKGYITVASKVGEGTSFQLFFPADETPNVVENQPFFNEEDFKGDGQLILVVDDLEDQRKIASDILRHLSYTVETVESGEAAVEYVKRQPVDLVILDMLMPPGIDGLETYEQILKINGKQKAIIASGYSQSSRIEEARKLGVTEYVLKPYSVLRIGQAVHKILHTQNL